MNEEQIKRARTISIEVPDLNSVSEVEVTVWFAPKADGALREAYKGNVPTETIRGLLRSVTSELETKSTDELWATVGDELDNLRGGYGGEVPEVIAELVRRHREEPVATRILNLPE